VNICTGSIAFFLKICGLEALERTRRN